MKNYLRRLAYAGTVTGFVACLGLAALSTPVRTYAEGTYQMNELQELGVGGMNIFVDILNVGETINISTCEGGTLEIYDTEGTPADNDDDTLVDNDTEYLGNLDCDQPVPNPITNAYEFTPESIGTYRISLDTGDVARYDFTVTPNASTNPDPTTSGGRVWAYEWDFSTGEYNEEYSTDADLYALVPAPEEGENFVWKLDLNNFSGNSYSLTANNIGLEAPYSGMSSQDGYAEPLYPIYLGYPAIAGDANTTNPSITGLGFLDDEGEDDTFSPGTTPGDQDTGVFSFTSNVDNATYSITIDTNKDGVYGAGDRVLLGSATAGVNEVEWDGNYANGDPVEEGNYNARVQLRIGEFHFVADDVENSGGTDDGVTWYNGLTIYKAIDADTTENTTVYWDDSQLMTYDEELDEEVPHPEASSNLPGGVTSGSTADANNDGKADGFHTWGDFRADGDTIGDGAAIDTYVYGASDTEYISMGVASVDGTDEDGVSSSIEFQAPNEGDGNGDGTADYLQDNVTSLPNPVADNAYSTLAIDGCESLNSVAILAENELSSTDSTYEYPMGMFNFEINCSTPGSTAAVTVYYDKVYDTSGWQARKFINGTYSNISGAVFGTANVGGTLVTTLSYSVTDGGPLDEDGTANGVIVDPVGPGTGGVGAPNTGIGSENEVIPFVFLIAGTAVLLSGNWYVRRREAKIL